MSEDLVSQDMEKVRTLTKVNILIHPLWKIKPDEYHTPDKERFDKERRQMAEVMLNEMSPKNENEATYFMPMLDESDRTNSLKDQIKRVKQARDSMQWPDLYRNMVAKVGHGRGIVFGTDLVGDFNGEAPDPEHFIKDLEKRGLKIDENTEIVVGGEMLRECLQTGIDQLLTLPEIHSLKVNTDASLTAGYLLSHDKSLDETDYKEFAKHYISSGFDVTQDGVVYTISKKN